MKTHEIGDEIVESTTYMKHINEYQDFDKQGNYERTFRKRKKLIKFLFFFNRWTTIQQHMTGWYSSDSHIFSRRALGDRVVLDHYFSVGLKDNDVTDHFLIRYS